MRNRICAAERVGGRHAFVVTWVTRLLSKFAKVKLGGVYIPRADGGRNWFFLSPIMALRGQVAAGLDQGLSKSRY